jgi:hypothetical protein
VVAWPVCRIVVVRLLCFPAGNYNRRNHNTPAHRSRNHTLYDIPPIRSVIQVTQTDQRSPLMMAGYCRNTYEPVYRIKEWYHSVHSVGYLFYFHITVFLNFIGEEKSCDLTQVICYITEQWFSLIQNCYII